MSKQATAIPQAPTIPADVLANLAKCDPHAVRCIADWGGPGYLNPIIGRTPTETFGRFNDALGFLHTLMLSDDGVDLETLPGLALLVQTMWVAAQYESHRQISEADHG